ncbi:TauD/TfdA family dioxygenase [Pelagibius marinus]|uniref:TauD/TfdA family dioxygenase n=1 Tax=Pelagibius marinus TaxID=2762760 RepID=UPI00187232D9|nr:TauD/TfdA family dioxygenase [Pelagibius marinus]
MPRITEARGQADGLVLRWDNGAESSFPWFWLRDHGQDPESLDPATLQRRVDTFALDEDISGKESKVLDEGRALAVTWLDDSGVESRYSADFLAAMSGFSSEEPGERPDLAPRLWSAARKLPAIEPVPHAEIGDGSAGLRRALQQLQRDGFVVVEGAPTDEASARALFGHFGYIRETIFGGLWSLSAELHDHEDTAYTTQYLEPHTDSTYCHDAPGLQCFLCQEFDGKGGESVLVDGFALAEELRAEQPEMFQVLSEVSVPGRYIEPGVHLRSEHPAIRIDDKGRLRQVSFNNYDRAPFLLEPARMKAFYRAYKDLHSRIVARDNWLTIPLGPGMALIFDNWRLLHGRLGYSGKRVFCGCYHNHEDYESALRTLA